MATSMAGGWGGSRFDGFRQFASRQQFPMNTLLNLSPLSKQQKSHLSKVYVTIVVGLVTSALGVHFQNNIFSLYMWLSIILQIICSFGVMLTARARMPADKVLSGGRGLYFLGMSFFTGCLVAPLLKMVNHINPSIVPMAFFGTLAIFICFSLSALFARERSYLFLGPILGSALSFGLLLSYINMLFRSSFIDTLTLYGGLLVYMGFIIYDTQITLEEFRRGNHDYLMHAVELYVDLFAIFIRIVAILAEREKKRKDGRS